MQLIVVRMMRRQLGTAVEREMTTEGSTENRRGGGEKPGPNSGFRLAIIIMSVPHQLGAPRRSTGGAESSLFTATQDWGLEKRKFESIRMARAAGVMHSVFSAILVKWRIPGVYWNCRR
jgi:hypothetical protein